MQTEERQTGSGSRVGFLLPGHFPSTSGRTAGSALSEPPLWFLLCGFRQVAAVTDQCTFSFDRLVSGGSSSETYLFACRGCCRCYASLTAQPKKPRNLSPCALVMGYTSGPTKT